MGQNNAAADSLFLQGKAKIKVLYDLYLPYNLYFGSGAFKFAHNE